MDKISIIMRGIEINAGELFPSFGFSGSQALAFFGKIKGREIKTCAKECK